MTDDFDSDLDLEDEEETATSSTWERSPESDAEFLVLYEQGLVKRGRLDLLDGDAKVAAAKVVAEQLASALHSAATDPERERIAKEHTATVALIADLETALPFEGRDDDALTEAFEDAEVAYEEAQEAFAAFKEKEGASPDQPHSARYRRARRKEFDALAAKDAVTREQRRRQDKAGYIKAREQLLASVSARKIEDAKAKNLYDLAEEMRGRVPIREQNFLLEQRRRELAANPPAEFTKKAREEAEAEYASRLEANALSMADQHVTRGK
jgi:hypothetical protein